MNQIHDELRNARAEVDALNDPARKVARLEVQLADLETQEQAERNLAQVKAARVALAKYLAEVKAAEDAMDQAARVAFTCWQGIIALAQRMPTALEAAMANNQHPIPHPRCPLNSETISRLKL